MKVQCRNAKTNPVHAKSPGSYLIDTTQTMEVLNQYDSYFVVQYLVLHVQDAATNILQHDKDMIAIIKELMKSDLLPIYDVC